MMKGMYDSDYFISMWFAVADNFDGAEAKLHETSQVFPKPGKAGPQPQRSRRGGLIIPGQRVALPTQDATVLHGEVF
jgi:hypothetical protein